MTAVISVPFSVMREVDALLNDDGPLLTNVVHDGSRAYYLFKVRGRVFDWTPGENIDLEVRYFTTSDEAMDWSQADMARRRRRV